MDIDIENYNATIESCSVVGHDISGQLHVLQFCAEELSEKYPDDQHVQKALSASEQLGHQVKVLRSFLTKSLLSESSKALYDIYKETEILIEIHHPRHFHQLIVTYDQSLSDRAIDNNYHELLNCNFTLFNFFIEELKKGTAKEIRLSISYEQAADGTEMLKLVVENTSVDFSCFEDLHEEASFVKKTIRKSLGYTGLFQSDNIKFEIFNEEQQEIYIIFDL